MRSSLRIGLAVCAVMVTAASLQSQTWDISGNSLLQGTYYFRQTIWPVGDSSGSLSDGVAAYGTISFDGNGHYTISSAQFLDAANNSLQALSTTGTYSISASGFGWLSHPVSSGDLVYGLVSKGIFIGSATESGYNDLFIAAQVPSPVYTNSSFRGAYSMMEFNLPDGVPTSTLDGQFQIYPDGNGNLGAVSLTGHIANRGSTTITQNISNVKYFFSNGAANVNFTGSLTTSNLIAGTKYLYFSPDGNFVFGGSPTGWDMIIGVRSGGSVNSFGGLYYQAGVYQDESTLSSGFADLDSYYGSLNASSGTVLTHRRVLSILSKVLDFNYSETYTPKGDSTYDDANNNHYVFGPNGAIRIGVGNGPQLGLNVAIQAPALSGSGPYINPTGVLNGASSGLFTSGIVPGELVSIYGTGLSPSTAADGHFPLQLAGVTVYVNGRSAPIYSVSPTQVSAVIPFGTTESIASIQLYSNGAASNIVSAFVNMTSPGVFTQPAGGIGSAAALHSDFSVVSSAHPAAVGETISVFVTGLGAVSPAIADGTPGPSNPLSNTTNTIAVYIGGQLATTSFTGIAPGLIGLYQINVTIPAGLTTGNALLQLVGPDFVAAQATIPIA